MIYHMGSCQSPPSTLFLSIFSIFILLSIVSADPISENNTSLNFQSNANLKLASVKAAASGQNDFTCGPGKPCINGACCGEDGWCGYSPTYCGDGCQSNCDAKAECGEYAATPGKTCPLNVCCSEHGFCGTTEEFCNEACQSNCEQPSPGGSPSNPRDIVIGYWEAWNMDKPCGTMGPGEIPVHLLTHLFVSFGYINDAYEITNMDGVDPQIFKTIGNVKLRNPALKVVIALGGWAFSDPGPWRSIFPEMTSTKENRATFIQNLLGFLSEYGYDGVDFDWEYPGAEDRGGQDEDGKNYTALLKELRAAIEASGRDYIVTFTAPSSYWYLRHFDLKGMEAEVNWINLMSYDLHGVWDGTNPIGNQVLSHTNLTEIDLALDLFWRVGVKPENIVLGLGFYGRSFELESASCWKPGCSFKGPGAEGRCSGSAGILAYNEIVEILDATGGNPYFDKSAAAKYMVYDGHSWISFDDKETFELKISYAAKMGLRGLMIWAIDLDTGSLEALRAVTGSNALPGSNSPFNLVDLERLFPPDMIPTDDAPKNWGLVNFGSNAATGAVDPNQTGFGFILVTGESHAMTSLRRRKDNPEPLVFLDCPENISRQPIDKVQKARVVCLSQDVEACFQIMERGVEGTIVEMPDNCGRNSFVRAISLEKSQDQTVPMIKGRKAPTSEVFDFSFDLNIRQKRQDAGKLSVRIDYSNTNGYWDSIVDSPAGDSSSSDKNKRYWSELPSDWRDLYGDADELMYAGDSNDVRIKETLGIPLYWDDVDDCNVEGETYYKGFGAHVEGEFDVEFTYGFTMITEIDDIMDVKQANGWLKVKGDADLTFSIGGVGKIDLDRGGLARPAWTSNNPVKLQDHIIDAGPSGFGIQFKPYWELDYMLGAFNDTSDSAVADSGPYFDGHLSARVKQDFGGYQVNFPPRPEDKDGSRNVDRDDNEISITEDDNVIYNVAGRGGLISLSSRFVFGLDVKMLQTTRAFTHTWDLVDMQASYNTMTEYEFVESAQDAAKACVDTTISTYGNQAYTIDEENTIGWGQPKTVPYVISDSQSPSDGPICYTQEPSVGEDLAWDYGPGESIDPNTFLPMDTSEDFGNYEDNEIKCSNCLQCDEKEEDGWWPCCGCVNLNIMFPGYSDIPSCESCNDPDETDGSWPGGGVSLTKRDEEDLDAAVGLAVDGSAQLYERAPGVATMSPKKVKACGTTSGDEFFLKGTYRYPAFPASPDNDWDGIEQGKWDVISKYWGNTSISCSNWETSDLFPHDTAWVSGPNGLREVRDVYQTEHVFEGQLIGDFFSWWLHQGQINNQEPEPSNPQPKAGCGFTRQYFLERKTTYPWVLDGEEASVIDLMLAELGSEAHKDRLTILKGRPNRMKGSMFGGKQPTSLVRFGGMTPDAQLTAAKEFGMVFTYLNNPDVWGAFCGTYDAIYDLLGEWDDWWSQNGSNFPSPGFTVPSMQDEWKNYIETVLKSLITRSQATFDLFSVLATIRIPMTLPNIAVYQSHWVTNRNDNRKLINITGTCDNLGPIRV